MVDQKKEDKKESVPFSNSSEIFESIFKEATNEIRKETGKVVGKPGLKPKPKPEVKPKCEAKPKAPIKVHLEPEPNVEPKQKPKPEAKPRAQAPLFKPRQDPIRRPVTRKPGADEKASQEPLLPGRPLLKSRIQEKKAEHEQGGTGNKPKPLKKEGKGSPILKVILLVVLLAVGVGGASVYFGIIDLSEYIGWPEPAKKESPKAGAAKPSPTQAPARPPQPAAPKPLQPSPAQAKPAEGAKPLTPAQTVQAPQPPPKPPEPVTPRPVKEVPAPAVKPETPAEPAKPASPLPASPVASPVQSEVKSEPKAPPAPVQPPAVAKKAETPQPSPQPKEAAAAKTVAPAAGSGAGCPYSVYLGSVQSMEFVKKDMSSYEGQGLSTYWSKVDLGPKGIWYRLFTGHFKSAQEAEAFIQQKNIKDGEVKETRYTNLIGAFRTKQAGEEKALALMKMGLSAYSIQAGDGQVRLFSGAFITKEGAEKNQAELNAKGIKSEIVER